MPKWMQQIGKAIATDCDVKPSHYGYFYASCQSYKGFLGGLTVYAKSNVPLIANFLSHELKTIAWSRTPDNCCTPTISSVCLFSMSHM